MKKFLFKTLLFLSVVFFVYFILSFFISEGKIPTNDYMAGIIIKHRHLDSIKTKRLIFAGGSNLAFGINSPDIEQQLKYPIANLGLHAGLGLSFILDELKQKAKDGDIIFLSIEYMLPSEGDYKLKKITEKFFPEVKNYYTTNYINEINLDIENTKNNIKELVQKKRNIEQNINKQTAVYSKNAFNSYGDVISHLSLKRKDKLLNRGLMEYKYWDGINLLNDFKNYTDSKNIKVYFLYPNYPLTEYIKNKKSITKYEVDLSKDLKIPILNSPLTFVYNDTLFFDTTYHLTKEGRIKRTEKLIDLLRNIPLSL